MCGGWAGHDCEGKEPTEKEYRYFGGGLVLFTYLHLAPLRELTDALVEKQVTGNCV